MAVRGVMLVAMFVLIVSATGCSTPTDGRATTPDRVPTTTSLSKARPTVTSPPSSKPGADDPLAGKSPCSLVGDNDRSQLGLTSKPKEKDYGDRRQCLFSEAKFATGVNVYDRSGLESVERSGRKVQAIPPVGRHKALKSTLGLTCSVTMEVTVTSMVEGTGTADTEAQSCEIAMKMALAIEPKLP